ncbi:MAG: class I tRNA ligase family protein, partial [Bacteroidetes bacterium]|nr:class I tRNA ligase family protein [Bacteroidota bacterium]
EKGLGKGKTNFRLRDAIFGRQRYWGEPIPVYYKDGIPKVLDEKELPLVLPEVDKYLPTETGEPPLARAASSWKKDGKYEYEHSTMPGWAGSSWYYLRYMDAHNDKRFASKEAIDYWQNIDLYIGGQEHATGHLLYVRFWTKFLYDLGLLSFTEPAKKLINQGMIQGISAFASVYKLPAYISAFTSGDEKRSLIDPHKIPPIYISENRIQKLKNNDSVTKDWLYKSLSEITLEIQKYTQDDLIGEVSALEKLAYPKHIPVQYVNEDIVDIDILKDKEREFKNAIFLKDEDDKFRCVREVEKMSKSKFNVITPDDIIDQYGADSLRLYEMFLGPLELSKPWNTNGITGVSNFIRKLWRLYHNGDVFNVSNEPATKPELKVLHKTIRKIVNDIENFSFNTSVSNFMICVNELTELKSNKREILEPLAIIIAPYAPYIAEELWEKLGHKESITFAVFPEYKEEYLVESAFNYPISFNGKTRFFQEYDLSLSKEDIEKEVMGLEQTQKYLEGKTPKKIIIVHNKIVNIVV